MYACVYTVAVVMRLYIIYAKHLLCRDYIYMRTYVIAKGAIFQLRFASNLGNTRIDFVYRRTRAPAEKERISAVVVVAVQGVQQ